MLERMYVCAHVCVCVCGGGGEQNHLKFSAWELNFVHAVLKRNTVLYFKKNFFLYKTQCCTIIPVLHVFVVTFFFLSSFF